MNDDIRLNWEEGNVPVKGSVFTPNSSQIETMRRYVSDTIGINITVDQLFAKEKIVIYVNL